MFFNASKLSIRMYMNDIELLRNKGKCGYKQYSCTLYVIPRLQRFALRSLNFVNYDKIFRSKYSDNISYYLK